jgi:hypothetical protein
MGAFPPSDRALTAVGGLTGNGSFVSFRARIAGRLGTVLGNSRQRATRPLPENPSKSLAIFRHGEVADRLKAAGPSLFGLVLRFAGFGCNQRRHDGIRRQFRPSAHGGDIGFHLPQDGLDIGIVCNAGEQWVMAYLPIRA